MKFFFVSLILSNFSVFLLILILSKNKTHLFCNASFLYWISCRYLFIWYYRSFLTFILLLFCFLNNTQQCFQQQLIFIYQFVEITKENLFQLIHNPNAIKFVWLLARLSNHQIYYQHLLSSWLIDLWTYLRFFPSIIISFIILWSST